MGPLDPLKYGHQYLNPALYTALSYYITTAIRFAYHSDEVLLCDEFVTPC